MRTVSEEMLRESVDRFERHNGRFDAQVRAYVAAASALGWWFGPEWAAKTLLLPNADGFLRSISAETPRDRVRHKERIIALGELLLNLQEVEGIEPRIESMKSDSIEAGIAELEGARILRCAAASFRFVEPTGVLGQDYDAEIDLPEGGTAACEMKCTVEGTTLSANTIRNSLETARKQLHNDKAGIIFLRVPDEWAEEELALNDAVKTALRRLRSGRITTIFVYFNRWFPAQEGQRRERNFLQLLNATARIHSPTIANIGLEARQAGATRWRFLKDVVT